jgi:phosphate-selective porin
MNAQKTMLKNKIVVILCCLCISTGIQAQLKEQELTPKETTEQKIESPENTARKLQKFNVSGYLQSQYQWGEKDATLTVGAPNEDPERSFNRIGIRRGRIKFVYEEDFASGTFQLDITEKGIGLKDAYLQVKIPWQHTLSLKAGVFNRPFGNEISYSSSRRESPERSTITQTLFPEERDLGVQLVVQAAKTSPLHFLKLEAGLFAGNGIKQESDRHKDFIGHLSAERNFGSDIKISGGTSYYNGGVYQGSETIFTMKDNAFVADHHPKNKGRFAKREYFGLNAEVRLLSVAGLSQLRTEYLWGEQPGNASGSKSPNTSNLPASDTYIRHFRGGYIIFVQDFGHTPFSMVLKYDRYDPNTQVQKNDAGSKGTGVGDIASDTFGFGLLWHVNHHLRVQTYYEINKNETTRNLLAYQNDRQDNIFTLRLQYMIVIDK